jgi:pimeloyl-ACP methyl ester carboxylesterase
MIIHGTSDKTVPFEATARAVARAVPHATLIEYAGEPHGVFATQPERLKEDLIAFLSGRAPEDNQVIIDMVTADAIALQPL